MSVGLLVYKSLGHGNGTKSGCRGGPNDQTGPTRPTDTRRPHRGPWSFPGATSCCPSRPSEGSDPLTFTTVVSYTRSPIVYFGRRDS